MKLGCAPLQGSFYIKIVIILQCIWYFSNCKEFGPTSQLKGTVSKDYPYFWHQLQVRGIPKTTFSFNNLREGLNRTHWKLFYLQLQFITWKGYRLKPPKRRCAQGRFQEKYETQSFSPVLLVKLGQHYFPGIHETVWMEYCQPRKLTWAFGFQSFGGCSVTYCLQDWSSVSSPSLRLGWSL